MLYILHPDGSSGGTSPCRLLFEFCDSRRNKCFGLFERCQVARMQEGAAEATDEVIRLFQVRNVFCNSMEPPSRKTSKCELPFLTFAPLILSSLGLPFNILSCHLHSLGVLHLRNSFGSSGEGVCASDCCCDFIAGDFNETRLIGAVGSCLLRHTTSKDSKAVTFVVRFFETHILFWLFPLKAGQLSSPVHITLG